MEDTRRSDFEVKGLDEVMDFMQEDDDLIAPSDDQFLNSENQMNELNFDFSESMKGLTLAASTENEMGREQVPQPSDSLNMEAKSRNHKCNLRKSLAWDSAFFTNAGVLDPEELSSMIGGDEIGGRKVLPGIQEDDIRSSFSTLDSDTLTLESLEAELFQDIRASIQKSNKAAINIAPSNMSSSQVESHISIPSLAKTHHSSENKAKLAVKNAPKKLPISATESPNKKNQSHQVTQDNHDARCKETSLIRHKLPNGPGKLSTIPPLPAKRFSTSANIIANEKPVPKRLISASRGAPLAKKSASGKPVLPRPTTTSKVSVSVSSKSTKEHSIVRSSAESSSSVPSSNAAKFPLDSLKRNIAPKSTKPPASTSTIRVPSRIKSKDSDPSSLKTKVQPVNSRLSAYVKSTATNISSISPASSISEWSIESSSSTSTVNQRSNNQRACAEAAPFSMHGAKEGDYPLAFDSQVQSGDSNKGCDAHAVTGLSNNFMNEHKTQSSLPHPAASQPSGLRMPSPKIGFFDGVKSLARTPKRVVQLSRGMPSGMAKGEGICTPTGGSSNTKIGKVQPHTSMSSQKKDNAQPASYVMKPVPHIPERKLPNSVMKKPSSLEAANHDPCLSSKLEKSVSPKTGGKSHLNSAEESSEILEGKSHDRFCRQNDTRIGVICADEDGTDRFYTSEADGSVHNMDNVPSKINLPKFESLVKKKEVTSETKVSLMGSLEANGEGLDFTRDPVISSGTHNDGETPKNGHKMLEHNSVVNFNNGSQNLPVTSSVTEGSKNSFVAAVDNKNVVQDNSYVGDTVPLTEETGNNSINGN